MYCNQNVGQNYTIKTANKYFKKGQSSNIHKQQALNKHEYQEEN